MPVYKNDETGKWDFKINYKEDGKYKQKMRRGFKGQKEAKAAMAEMEDQLNKGTYVEHSKVLFRDVMRDWLNDKKIHIKRGTLATYSAIINNHILPMRKNSEGKIVGLGDVEVGGLTIRHIKDLYNHLFESGSLSDDNIQKCHSIINDCLKQAKVEKMIADNPAEYVKRPTARKKEMEVWSKDEAHLFLKAAETDPLHMAFQLELATGMRQGELLGLRWKDVDFDNRVVSITQILNHDGKGFDVGAKTDSGSRPIKVDVKTMEALAKYKTKSRERRLEFADVFQDYGLVFCTRVGTPISPRNLNRTFKRIIDKAGIKEIRFHDLRHTHATFLIKNRETPQAIAERMGWSDTRMIDKYAHIRPDIQEDVADSFGESFYA